MRSLTFWMLFVAGLATFLPVPAIAAEGGTGLKIPDGFVVMTSLFEGESDQIGVTYNLGLIVDLHTIITTKRAVMAHPKNEARARLTYRIIILTSTLEVLSADDYQYSPNSEEARIITDDTLPTADSPPVAYDYQPTIGEELHALLLISAEGEPLEIADIKLEPLAIEQTEVVVTDQVLGAEVSNTYYLHQLRLKQGESLPLHEIHNGFVLRDDEVVGLILEHRDGRLFLLPLRQPDPPNGGLFYNRK